MGRERRGGWLEEEGDAEEESAELGKVVESGGEWIGRRENSNAKEGSVRGSVGNDSCVLRIPRSLEAIFSSGRFVPDDT